MFFSDFSVRIALISLLIFFSSVVSGTLTTDCDNDVDFCLNTISEDPDGVDGGAISIVISSGFDSADKLRIRRTSEYSTSGCGDDPQDLYFSVDQNNGSYVLQYDSFSTGGGSHTIYIPFFKDSGTNLLCNYSSEEFGTYDFGDNSDGKYSIRIYKGGGTDSEDEVTSLKKEFIIDHEPPGVIPKPIVKSGDGKLEISWTGVTDVNAKTVDGSGLKHYTVTARLEDGTFVTSMITTDTTATFEDLQNRTIYEIAVTAEDKLGNVQGNYNKEPQVPLEISGFLSEDAGCFVATATFGYSEHPVVMIFREFRDKILLKSNHGVTLVNLYYKYSPQVAGLIAGSPVLRMVSFVILATLAFFASLILLKPGAFASFAGGALVIFLIRFFFDRYRKSILSALVMAVLLFPAKALSKAPVDKDLIQHRSYEMIEGDFGSPLRESEVVTQKYTSGKIKDLNFELRVGAKKPSRCMEFVIGPLKPAKNFSATDKDRYENVYSDRGGYQIMMSIDHNLFRNILGILSVNTAFGFFRDGGSGLRDPADIADYSAFDLETTSDTSFFFNVARLELGLSYRARFHRKQYIAPFGRVAVGYYPYMETRIDQSSGLWGNYGAGKVLAMTAGVEMNFTSWSKRVRRVFENDYGIFAAHLNVQIRIIQDLVKSGPVSFQDQYLLAGLMFEI